MSGYEGAPIIQTISILSFIFGTALNSTARIELDLYRVISHGEVWRLVLSTVAFKNTAETVVGLLLLYTCREFERQMGSKKFASFVVISFMVGTLLLVGAIVASESVGVSFRPAPGPYLLVFSILPLFHRRVPKLHPATVAGFHISEKSWTYLLASQLFLCDGLDSIGVALMGLLTGILYNQDGSRLQKLRLPSKAEELWVKIHSIAGNFTRFLSGPVRQQTPAGGLQQQQQQQQQQPQRGENLLGGGGGGGLIPPPAPVVAPPDEVSITSLMDMGFEREAAIGALQRTGNNIEAAANILLR